NFPPAGRRALPPAWYATDGERVGDPDPPERPVDLGLGGGRHRERDRTGRHPGQPFRAAPVRKGGASGRVALARWRQDCATTGESDRGRFLGDLVRALPVLHAASAEPVERIPAARRRALFSGYGRSGTRP